MKSTRLSINGELCRTRRLKVPPPKLVFKELGITTRVIRDLFSDEVSQVYVDQEEDFKEIQSYLRSVSPDLCDRVIMYKDKTPLFDKFNIEKDLELSLKRKVWLKSGGYILFDHAEALLAIDVNTGRNVGKANMEDTIFKHEFGSGLGNRPAIQAPRYRRDHRGGLHRHATK